MEDIIKIPLASRKNPGLFAIVDSSDFELVSAYSWFPRKNYHTFYVQHSPSRTLPGERRPVLMHRLLLGLGPGDQTVDHINGNGLDNRRENLRLCSDSTNQANRHRLVPNASSRYRGVTWHAALGKWQAHIKVMGRSIYLGVFASEEEAALAYNHAAVAHFREYAHLNEVSA